MNKTILWVLAVLVLMPALANAQSPASGFTGTWSLDKQKTSKRDYPEKLTNYTMTVGEGDNLLNIKTQVEGHVEVELSKDRPVASGSTGVSANPASSTATPSTSGRTVMASTPATSSVTPSGEIAKRDFGGTLALSYTPKEVTYNLNGEEIKVEIKQGDKVAGIAKIKAKLDKSGKSLQFTTVRRMKTNYGEMEITTRESWKLSDDGKSLKLQRSVETPNARDQITMVLVKPVAG